MKGLKSLDDFAILGKAFPKISAGINAYVNAIKSAEGATGKFKATFTGLGAAMEANPVGAVIAGVVALVGVIKLVDYAIDKANDSTDELIEKKQTISDNISDIESQIGSIDEQIEQLNNQKLNITDPDDIDNLNTQLELLEQRKHLLEWKAKNERKENENTANDIIEGTKNNSTYSGAVYMDGVSGKLSKGKDFFYSLGGAESPAKYSTESYIDGLENRLNSIHPEELESVVDNLNDIYETYDKIAQDNTLVGTEAYNVAIEKQKQINELLEKTQYLQSVRNGLDRDFIDDNKFLYDLGGYTEYQKNLSELITKGYSNGGMITVEDVENQFEDYSAPLKEKLTSQGKTIEDYVAWINSSAAKEKDFIEGVSSDASGVTSKLTKDAKESIDSSKESVNNLIGKIKSVQEILNSQKVGESISADAFGSAELADYRGALEYVNGTMQLNAEKVNEITKAKVQEEIATNNTNKAMEQAKYLENAAQIEKLRQQLKSIQNENWADSETKNTINAQIDALLEENAAIAEVCQQGYMCEGCKDKKVCMSLLSKDRSSNDIQPVKLFFAVFGLNP